MPQIVKKRGQTDKLRLVVVESQSMSKESSNVADPEAVLKSRVCGAWIHLISKR
jgi:hypothetical protein